jgi:hypothetical protein
MAWGSVIAAACVMAILIFAASKELHRVQSQLGTMQRQVDNETKTLDQLKEQKRQVEEELAAARVQLYNYQGIVANVPKEAAQAAAAEATYKSAPGALLPRVYLHIVDEKDRAYAKEKGRLLEGNGYVVLGVEYVRNVPLKNTQVRYYTKNQCKEAARLVDVLQKAGDPNTVANYLGKPDFAKTHPNQFEIWFMSQQAKDARESNLQSPSKPAKCVEP